MKRTIGLSALVAGALLSAGSLSAQSDNSGVMLNLHLAGQGLALVGDETEAETGGGLGVALGYGFNDRVTLFLNIDGSAIQYDEDVSEETGDDTYSAVTADLGVRMNFGNEGMKLRPYINAAFSGLAVVEEFEIAGEDVETTLSGGGLTVGGGLQYFFTSSLAVDVALQATQGAFTNAAVDDEDEDLEQGIAFTSSRLQLGLTWHP